MNVLITRRLTPYVAVPGLLWCAMIALFVPQSLQAQGFSVCVVPPDADQTEAVQYTALGHFVRRVDNGAEEYEEHPAIAAADNDPYACSADIEPGLAINNLYWYADNSGRTRSSTQTDDDAIPASGANNMVWRKRFVKRTAGDTAHFTVNPSQLYYINGRKANFYIAVLLGYEDQETNEKVWSLQFLHDATIAELSIANGTSGGTGGDIFRESGYYHAGEETPGRGPLQSDRQLVPFGNEANAIAQYDTLRFRGAIDLTPVRTGSEYEIEYHLGTSAADKNVPEASRAHGKVGDPLDVDGGVELELDSEPSTSAIGGQPLGGCDIAPDDARYSASTDGTVVDTYTGLMWRRCPLGYELDDNGTTTDANDDRCEAVGDRERTWQVALQDAAADATGGFDDWRTPDVKELDSIVELSCQGASDPKAFPPIAERTYWSSTPSATDRALSVSFSSAEIHALARTEAAYVRPVRSTGRTPQAARPAIDLGFVRPVEEGDSGATAVVVPVTMNRALDEDVTFNYSLVPATASAGSDYEESTGTVTIPAGMTAAEIQIDVVGDTLAETAETFQVVASGVTSRARLRRARSTIQIADDEPTIDVNDGYAVEEASGANMEFLVKLDRPATSEIAFEYSLQSDGAIAGQDFTAVSDTLVIPVGADSATISASILADAVIEPQERLRLVLSPPDAGNAHLERTEVYGYILYLEQLGPFELNDTGNRRCLAEFNGYASCPVADYPGQDAESGRDVEFNDDTDGMAGLSFTRIDATGAAMTQVDPDYDVTPWSCVLDHVTGRMWEVKTDDGGLHDSHATYSWYNGTGANDGGVPGTEDGGECATSGRCDTEKYVEDVNAQGLCGYHDWRLPKPEELRSITFNERGITTSLDARYFPNGAPDSSQVHFWWTDQTVASYPFGEAEPAYDHALSVFLINNATTSVSEKSVPLRVRLVRTAADQPR